MKYLIAYKQSEDTYMYVTGIGSKIDTAMLYAYGLDFLSEKNAENVASFLNEYDPSHEYIVVKYEYSLEEL